MTVNPTGFDGFDRDISLDQTFNNQQGLNTEWKGVRKIAILVVDVACAIFGAAFIAMSGMGPVGTILAGTVVAVLSGVGGFAWSCAVDMFMEGKKEVMLLIVIAAVIGVIGALVFGGGLAAAGIGALVVPGAVVALIGLWHVYRTQQ